MNQDVKGLWTEALESGEYPQTKNRLKDDDGYCCLGVLCELAVQAGVICPFVETEYGWVLRTESDHEVEAVLPLEVQIWAGLDNCNPHVVLEDAGYSVPISDPNDGGMSFEEIAKLIAEQL